MGLADILGQIMQDGLKGQGQSRDRLQTTADNVSGGGLDSIFAQLQGALGKAGIDTAGLGQSAGGFAERARDFARNEQVGGLSGGQIGGIGALAGALLGGGIGGAAKGGAMAVLGTLAIAALKRAQAAQGGDAEAPSVEPHEIRALTGPESERVLVAAMISAAKADGSVDTAEMQKIIGRVGKDAVTDEEKQFVLDQMAAPIDISALASEAKTPAQAAEIYAASILAIDADTDAEKAYLRELATALNLDAGTVGQLHQMTGVPA